MLELFRPRRVLVPDLRIHRSGPFRWPSRREAVLEPRYHVRARRLTLEQERSIQALAAAKSLRELAAEFGVSHETVRGILRCSPVESIQEPSSVPASEPGEAGREPRNVRPDA